MKIHTDEIMALLPPAHPLSANTSITPRDLVGFPLLMPKSGTTRSRLNTWLDVVEDELTVSMELDSTEMIKRFVMAELDTELDIAEQYVDRCLRAVVDGELTAVEASKAKWWCTELGKKVIDQCLQLHGGYGYMNEYRVAKDYVDVRIQTIYGGTTEIMKEIIGRNMGF